MDLDEKAIEDRARATLAMSLASYALAVPVQKIAGAQRTARVALARQVAMYVAHVGFGISMARVGFAFGRDRTTVGHACRMMEDWRDDLRFDRWIDTLERAAEAAPAPYAFEPLARPLFAIPAVSPAMLPPVMRNWRRSP